MVCIFMCKLVCAQTTCEPPAACRRLADERETPKKSIRASEVQHSKRGDDLHKQTTDLLFDLTSKRIDRIGEFDRIDAPPSYLDRAFLRSQTGAAGR